MRADRTQFWLWGILTVALTLRIIASVMVQQHVSQTPGRLCLIAGDAEGYWELGRKLAHGQNYEIYDPPRRVLRMPGFPAVLAASIAVFGEQVGAARLVLAVMGTLACACVYWLGAELFGRTTGLFAAALAAVSPTFIATSAMILSETTFALGLMLSLIPLARLVRVTTVTEPRWRVLTWGVIAGLGGAIACYVRPSWLLFPLLAGGWLVFLSVLRGEQPWSSIYRSAGVWACLGIVLGMTAGLMPWTFRNYVVTGGHIVPTTLWMGPSLYDGLNPEANGDSNMEFLKREGLYQNLSEYEVDQHYRRAAWNWAAQHPGRAISLGWIKLGRYWNLWPNTAQFGHWLVRLVLLAFLIPAFACTIWGFSIGRSKLPEGGMTWSWVLILTVGPILYFSGLHILFVGSLRYRLPAEYPLLIIAAVGFQDLVKRLRPDEQQRFNPMKTP